MHKPESGLGHFHGVRFYDNAEHLCRIVADFIAEGLAADESALLIATPLHRDGILKRLHETAWRPRDLVRAGKLTILDARDTLREISIDGEPDAVRFEQVMSAGLDKACGGVKERPIRAYGEMVDLLWKDGNQAAAIRLEILWNQLAATRAFSLLCGYSMGNFYKDSAIVDILAQHTQGAAESGVFPAVQ